MKIILILNLLLFFVSCSRFKFQSLNKTNRIPASNNLDCIKEVNNIIHLPSSREQIANEAIQNLEYGKMLKILREKNNRSDIEDEVLELLELTIERTDQVKNQDLIRALTNDLSKQQKIAFYESFLKDKLFLTQNRELSESLTQGNLLARFMLQYGTKRERDLVEEVILSLKTLNPRASDNEIHEILFKRISSCGSQ